MDDWVMVVMTTVVAPVLSGSFAYLVTRRKDEAEGGKAKQEGKSVEADTAGKYRTMLNSEIEERRKAEERCDELDDAFKQCVEENGQLRAENQILRNQVRAAGLPDLLRSESTRGPVTKPRRDVQDD